MKLEPMTLSDLAALLTAERKRQKLTRAQAAAVCNVSPSFIRDAETQPERCTLGKLVQLINGLGLVMQIVESPRVVKAKVVPIHDEITDPDHESNFDLSIANPTPVFHRAKVIGHQVLRPSAEAIRMHWSGLKAQGKDLPIERSPGSAGETENDDQGGR